MLLTIIDQLVGLDMCLSSRTGCLSSSASWLSNQTLPLKKIIKFHCKGGSKKILIVIDQFDELSSVLDIRQTYVKSLSIFFLCQAFPRFNQAIYGRGKQTRNSREAFR